MLKSYEAIYEKGQMKWLKEQPEVESARVVVTILEETGSGGIDSQTEHKSAEQPIKRRCFPTHMAGKTKILGDIVSPIVDERDWECLK